MHLLLINNKEVPLMYPEVKKELWVSYLEDDILIELTWEITG